MLIYDGDLVPLLQQLDIEVPENVGHRLLEALVVRIGKRSSGERNFAHLLNDLRGVGSEDGIGVIANIVYEPPVDWQKPDWPRTRKRWVKAQCWVCPNGGK